MQTNTFARLASIAPLLKEAELRVLIHLVAVAGQDQRVNASSRQLATACGVARRNVQTAIDGLTERELITVEPGTAVRPATYTILLEGGGAVIAPPMSTGWRHNSATPGVETAPGAITAPPSGVKAAPPPIENKEEISTPSAPYVLRARASDPEINQIDRSIDARAQPSSWTWTESETAELRIALEQFSYADASPATLTEDLAATIARIVDAYGRKPCAATDAVTDHQKTYFSGHRSARPCRRHYGI